jgi:hypothetical protein
MKLLCRSIVLALLVSATAYAQKAHDAHPAGEADPTKLLPRNFTREFENDWVNVTRAHYDANSKLPAHEHSGGISVYLYLNASDGVIYSHIDGDAAVPRRPVLPGSIRVAETPHEYHTVVNNAATPSDFIRVLLKTEIHNRVAHAAARMTSSIMEYDHAFVRVARVNIPPRTTTRIEAKNYPVFRMAVLPGTTEWRMTAANAYRFLDKGTTEEFENTGDVPIQLVTIELKTKIAAQPK